jgi:hypothetical protein
MHDIPLYADEANKVFNMVVEIPRWTNAKMEVYFIFFPHVNQIIKLLVLSLDQPEGSVEPHQAGYQERKA